MPLPPRFQIRATRAHPPARAGDEARRDTYGASLAQFDELMTAATANSAAARPLPLFYALSQAGRAIAAAHASAPWQLRMHGLHAPNLDGSLLSIAVKRTALDKDTSVDSFTGVARATGSPAFSDHADIGALWASLPEACDLLPGPAATTPLLLVPTGVDAPVMAWDYVGALIIGYDGAPEDLPAYLESHFPTSAGVRLVQPQGLPHVFEHHTDYGPGLSVVWPAEAPDVSGHIRTLERVAPLTEDFSPRWLRPSVSGVALSSLLTWWALLFGLSMVARYEPAGWVGALRYDESELAAPLERLLDVGLDRVPELVLGALLDVPA
jgi:hypothetical protein